MGGCSGAAHCCEACAILDGSRDSEEALPLRKAYQSTLTPSFSSPGPASGDKPRIVLCTVLYILYIIFQTPQLDSHEPLEGLVLAVRLLEERHDLLPAPGAARDRHAAWGLWPQCAACRWTNAASIMLPSAQQKQWHSTSSCGMHTGGRRGCTSQHRACAARPPGCGCNGCR